MAVSGGGLAMIGDFRNLLDTSEELVAIGVQVRHRAGISGKVSDTFWMHGATEWSPEFHARVRDVLSRHGLQEHREGLWTDTSIDEEGVRRWEALMRTDYALFDPESEEET